MACVRDARGRLQREGAARESRLAGVLEQVRGAGSDEGRDAGALARIIGKNHSVLRGRCFVQISVRSAF